MMTSRIFLGLGLSIVTSGAFAQTLQDAITKTDNERFEAASADFRTLIAKEPTKGDNYFYFGENYFKNGDLDSAMMMYKKGSEVQATNALNYVGIGKVLLFQGNDADANTNLFKAKTLGPKNATVLMKMGEAFTITPKNKNLPEAIKLLNEAIKHEPKNAEAQILLGDALLEQNPADGGPAIKCYDKAAELNPKSPKGVLRAGKLYQRGKNYPLALDYYKKAETIDPNYAPAYREKAELYHLAGQDAKAIESYKKYLELNNSLEARDRYASFLFLNKQYKEAISEIENIQQKDNSSFYLDRILGYSYYELNDKNDPTSFKKGLDALNRFFDKTAAKSFKYVADDYKYKGLLMAKNGQDSLGVLEIEKAIALDADANCELNGEIAKIYMKAKRYEKTIAAYDKKALCPKGGLNGQDYFDLGRAYFYMGGAKEKESNEAKDAATKAKKEAEGKELFIKADSAFSKLCQSSPTFATGYFWRGSANIHLDPKDDKGLAKPYYDKGLSLVKPEERANGANKSKVIEACLYLGSHYAFSKEKDLAKAKEYFTIVRDLDPNNKAQKDFFASPAGK